MAMLRRLNSKFDNDTASGNAASGKMFKTWPQLLDELNIDPVEIPWNATGMAALEILRGKYGVKFYGLKDLAIDEAVQKYKGRSSEEQLSALGTAVQQHGLYLCRIHTNFDIHYYIDTIDRIQEIKKKREPFAMYRVIESMCSVVELGRDKSLENPTNDILFPVSAIQVSNPDSSFPYLLEHFLIVPYKLCDDKCHAHIELRVYDVRYWPLRELKYELSFDSNNIEPYTLIIESECGEKFCYVGSDVERFVSMHKTILSENGEYLPVYDDRETRFYYRRLKEMVKLGDNTIDKPSDIPEINDATLLMLVDNCVIYHYTNDDIDHRKPEISDMSPTMRFLRFCEKNRKWVTLLEYSPLSKKFRKLELPGLNYVSDLVVYKNNWIVLPYNNHSRTGTSYILRLWNPRTNECLRLTSQDLGYHDIVKIFPAPNNDILILLDDGRLCHLDVDLVSWLKQDLQTHEVTLEPWQDEVRRSYENFPELSDRYQRLRQKEADDRMLITFSDGKTYDIMIREGE
jgi:hypothetical protein